MHRCRVKAAHTKAIAVALPLERALPAADIRDDNHLVQALGDLGGDKVPGLWDLMEKKERSALSCRRASSSRHLLDANFDGVLGVLRSIASHIVL